jgi:hypothetical protein
MSFRLHNDWGGRRLFSSCLAPVCVPFPFKREALLRRFAVSATVELRSVSLTDIVNN